MKLVHRRDIIRGVRDAWNRQYANYDQQHRFPSGGTVGDACENLKHLDLEMCTAADVDRALAVSGWASNICDECGSDEAVLVRFGDTPDYDARWQDLCAACLDKAVALLRP